MAQPIRIYTAFSLLYQQHLYTISILLQDITLIQFLVTELFIGTLKSVKSKSCLQWSSSQLHISLRQLVSRHATQTQQTSVKQVLNITCLESQLDAGRKTVGYLESVATKFTMGFPKINRTSERVERLLKTSTSAYPKHLGTAALLFYIIALPYNFL